MPGSGVYRCGVCNELGHTKRTCPRKKKPSAATGATQEQVATALVQGNTFFNQLQVAKGKTAVETEHHVGSDVPRNDLTVLSGPQEAAVVSAAANAEHPLSSGVIPAAQAAVVATQKQSLSNVESISHSGPEPARSGATETRASGGAGSGVVVAKSSTPSATGVAQSIVSKPTVPAPKKSAGVSGAPGNVVTDTSRSRPVVSSKQLTPSSPSKDVSVKGNVSSVAKEVKPSVEDLLRALPGHANDQDVFVSRRDAFALAGQREVEFDELPANTSGPEWSVCAHGENAFERGASLRCRGMKESGVVIAILADISVPSPSPKVILGFHSPKLHFVVKPLSVILEVDSPKSSLYEGLRKQYLERQADPRGKKGTVSDSSDDEEDREGGVGKRGNRYGLRSRTRAPKATKNAATPKKPPRKSKATRRRSSAREAEVDLSSPNVSDGEQAVVSPVKRRHKNEVGEVGVDLGLRGVFDLAFQLGVMQQKSHELEELQNRQRADELFKLLKEKKN